MSDSGIKLSYEGKGVELRKHVAKRVENSLGVFETEFDQWMLFLDGQQIGYVPKRHNGHISLIRKLDPELAQRILEEVERIIGGPRSKVSMPSMIVERSSGSDANGHDGTAQEAE